MLANATIIIIMESRAKNEQQVNDSVQLKNDKVKQAFSFARLPVVETEHVLANLAWQHLSSVVH
jgi:hypothetical protein